MVFSKKVGRRNIKFLGASSLFNDIGSEMITPILPFFITALGGGGLAIGALSGLREGLSSLFKIFGGFASDRIGKAKVFIFLGYIISILSRVFLGFVNSIGLIIGAISIERFGKLRDAPRDTIILDSTHHRGKAFGIHQMMDTLGGVIGTLIVIFLFWKFQFSFKTIIFIAAGISSISILPLFLVKEKKKKPIKKTLFGSIKNLDYKLKYFVFVSAVFTLANFGLYLFLILLAKEVTGNTVSALILYAVFGLFYAMFVIPFGKLSDRIGRKKVLIFGQLLFIGLVFILFRSLNIYYLIASFVIYGLVMAIVNSNQKALVSDLSGEMKGTAMGLFYSVNGLVNIPAGIVAGLLWDVSYKIMFTYVGIVAVISTVLLFFVKEDGEYKK